MRRRLHGDAFIAHAVSLALQAATRLDAPLTAAGFALGNTTAELSRPSRLVEIAL